MNTSGNNYNDGYTNQALEEMYPEVYHAVYPKIRQKAMYMRGLSITPQMLDSTVNDIMWDSGMPDTDMPDMTEEPDRCYDSVVTVARFGRPPRYGRPHDYRGDYRPRNRYPHFMRPEDLIRILLLRELV